MAIIFQATVLQGRTEGRLRTGGEGKFGMPATILRKDGDHRGRIRERHSSRVELEKHRVVILQKGRTNFRP